jgi:hypothetical protein
MFDTRKLRRRERSLAGSARTARRARESTWSRLISEVRYEWPLYLFILCFPTLMGFLLTAFVRGEERGFLLGALLVAGISTAGVTVLLMSGVASILMGLHAEEWTAQRLRPLRRKGWLLVNGLQLRAKSDIDHVVIGPPGLIVIETKWSAERWPTFKEQAGFMDSSLKNAVDQVSRNCRDVHSNFRRVLGDTPVGRACVLWTSNVGSEKEHIWNYDGVTIIPGVLMGSWIASLDENNIDGDRILEIWEAIANHVRDRDGYDARQGVLHRPSLKRLAGTRVLAPMVASFIGIYASLGVTKLAFGWPVTLSIVAAFVALGTLGLNYTKTQSFTGDWFRPALWGWVSASAMTLLLFLGIVLKSTIT